MPHEDGAAYSPVVATISLGGTVVLDLYAKREDKEELAGDGETQEPTSEALEPRTGLEPDGEDDSRPRPTWRILQEPGSLLVTTGEAYVSLIHGISPIAVDKDLGPRTVANWNLLGNAENFEEGFKARETRISLTYRDVLKVSKVGMNILGRR